ncbi:MAG: type II toxin-antitoxin system RelE/ParE family toxin [Deltaproteobacteria bacterium]|nr:type II toxin-antitoxin system RelE/ParE family toxin [Deltaproteobacteria bacterium]
MYTLLYHHAVKKDIARIPKKIALKIKQAIENKIAIGPLDYGVPLRGSLKPCFKFRVGDYRIIHDVLDSQRIIILMIAHRKDVYHQAGRRK